MLFFLFLLCFLLLCHCMLPPYMAQQTGLTSSKRITFRIVKEADKCSYNFYRPNIKEYFIKNFSTQFYRVACLVYHRVGKNVLCRRDDVESLIRFGLPQAAAMTERSFLAVAELMFNYVINGFKYNSQK